MRNHKTPYYKDECYYSIVKLDLHDYNIQITQNYPTHMDSKTSGDRKKNVKCIDL